MRVFVVSDVHYAGAAERARRGWESRAIRNPLLRAGAAVYRDALWLRDPTGHNHRLEAFLARAGGADLVIANGDYSCDSAYVGVADDAACASAAECLGRLRAAFPGRLHPLLGDHELGKFSLFGRVGGLRLASHARATRELEIPEGWRVDVPGWSLVGVTSSLVALPVLEREALPEELGRWAELRAAHLAELDRQLTSLPPDARWLLFCHDPTALPFLLELPSVRAALPRLGATIIGHLHSELVLRPGRLLAGMPEIRFLGATARRLSGALRRAGDWAPFKVRLCPSPAGTQLLKDGGYLEIGLAPDHEPEIVRHRLPW
ncbi:MAG: metallophosphoesterase [Limisphaerales bacterium]